MHQYSKYRCPRVKRKERKALRNIFEEIIVENFPNMEKEIVNHVQEGQRVPYRINPRRNTSRHIVIKLVKIKDKNIKATSNKQQITYKGTPIGYQLISQQKLYKSEGNGMIYFK